LVRRSAFAVIVLLSAASAAAAEISVTARLNNHNIALGDQIVLSVAINGSGSAVPKPPLIPDVEIYESGKSQSMTIINGRVSSSVVHTFVLNPRKTGRFVLPPLEVPGAAPAPAPRPGATPDAFVTATLEKNRAIVNEQVTLVVRFFTAVPLLGAPQYDAPKLTGLLSETLGTEGQGTTMIGGRSYNFSELKSALFPVQAGRASIGPAVVMVQLPRRGGLTGDDFFDRFFNAAPPEARRLQTDPLTLQTDPLPAGTPDDFSGIVGALTVESSVDRTQIKAGEALTLSVVVSGVGNIKSLPEPKRPDLPAVRFFDSESSVKLERIGDRIGGAKTFKTVLVARVSGPLEIPPLTVSYYDPARQAYVRAQSKPIRLTVLPGDPNASLPVVGPGSAAAPGVAEVAADIRYLKTPNGSGLPAKALAAFAAFGRTGPWHALPGAFLMAALALELRRRALAANPRARRASEARAASERRLRQAEAQPAAERARAVALLGEALTGYFADKFDQPAASLTLKAVSHRLQNGRKPAAAAELMRLKSVWDELDLLRYAPGAAGQAEVKRLAYEIRDLTLAFDKELRS
jgi:hypothetical protein